MTRILITDAAKKQAKDELAKLKGREIKKMTSAELAKLLEIVYQHLGLADSAGVVK